MVVCLSFPSLTFSPQDRRDDRTGLCRQLPTPSQSPEKGNVGSWGKNLGFGKKIKKFQTSNIDMAINLLTTLQRVFPVTEHLELVDLSRERWSGYLLIRLQFDSAYILIYGILFLWKYIKFKINRRGK